MERVAILADKQPSLDQYDNPTDAAIHSRDTLRAKIVERESKKPGFKGKIRASCCQCIFDPHQKGSWLKQVENCTSPHCPLFSVRPIPSRKVGDG